MPLETSEIKKEKRVHLINRGFIRPVKMSDSNSISVETIEVKTAFFM